MIFVCIKSVHCGIFNLGICLLHSESGPSVLLLVGSFHCLYQVYAVSSSLDVASNF